MYYSVWYNAPKMLPAGSMDVEELRFKATHCNTQASAPEDGWDQHPY